MSRGNGTEKPTTASRQVGMGVSFFEHNSYNVIKSSWLIVFTALHFKLVVGGDELTEKLDEPQFIYMPQLDPNRDQDLIDMLPDYLVEEITFPQSHAARFYSRVMRSLTERLE